MTYKRIHRIGRALAFFFCAGCLIAADGAKAGEAFRKSSAMVAMRDGVRLSTDVYQPTTSPGPFPVIFMRGPYGKAGSAGVRSTACKKGYVLVVQDMRGRFDSEGNDAVVFHNDGWGQKRDGQNSLEWIARQPWCNGRIGTYGGSALGVTQTMMAPGATDALRAQYVQVAFSDMYSQGAFQGGAWRKNLIEFWLTAARFGPENLETFLKHPKYDDFWAQTNAEAQVARVNAPGVYVGGWYDIFLQGTINSFVTIHNHGGPRARGQCRLIIGPIAHGPFDTVRGSLKYPANSSFPAAADAFRFFDFHLKGDANGVAEDKPVHYYVMGDPTDPKSAGNFWRSADSWPPASQPTAFYFQQDGRLSPERSASARDQRSYEYNPVDPVPTQGGQNLAPPRGPADLRPIESRKDVLAFRTDLLTDPLEITGRITADLFVSSDCPDTDFTATLADVYPDGRSMLVTDGILRARYRKSFEREDFLEPSKTYELAVDLWSTSLVFDKGHRICVLISSSNAPRFDPNPNTGSPFRADKKTRVAYNTLHLSAEHPSHILLPVHRKGTSRD